MTIYKYKKTYYYLRQRFYMALARLQGRDILVLSYPKCGRTWIMNVLANYSVRVRDPEAAPLPFYVNQKNEAFEILAREGVAFSHGAPLKRVRNRTMNVHALRLARRNTAFLVRDPLMATVSLYHHRVNNGNLAPEMPLTAFLETPEGIDTTLWYMARILEKAEGNENFKVFYYEDLHHTAPRALENMAALCRFAFGSVDREALAWAYNACLPAALKARASGSGERVRQARAELDDTALAPYRALVTERIDTLPSPAQRVLGRYKA